ncbi:MAG: PAS domain S-box protein [Deltaproteobacteria bacterium]|jgi:PAS domain S-box-containing protein|nr:PAS domain S-box protein [Deltaproteobacteria bacterium]
MEKARILIVEDEAIIAMEIENQLQSLGYEVISIVDTGEKAIAKAEVDKPDLILMDIRIKGEMDGIDTAEVIRNRFGIPVIFSTAYLDENRIERAKITMPFGYVLKPIQERDLKVTIEMALYVSKADIERKKVEEKLRKSDSLHKEAQTVAHIGHWELDSPTGTPIWSNEVFRIFGLDPEADAPSFSEHRNIIHTEDWPSLEKSIALLNEDGTPFNLQFRIFRSDGKIGWMHAIGTAEINSVGGVTRMFGTAQDITELKKAEELLQKSEEKYRSVVDNVNEAIFVAQDGKLKYFNSKTIELLEFAENKLGTKPFLDFIHPDHKEMVLDRHLRRLKGESFEDVYSFKINTGSGKVKWVEIKPVIINWDNKPATLNFLSDITERRQAEGVLEKNEKHLKDIINSISYPFHVIDVKTKIIKHASKETGEDVVGKTCYLVTHNSSVPCNTKEHTCPIDSILKTKKSTIVEHIHLHPDGSERLIEIHASPLFDENGEVEYIVESNIYVTSGK